MENSRKLQDMLTLCFNIVLLHCLLASDVKKTRIKLWEFYFNRNKQRIGYNLLMTSVFQFYVCPKLHQFLKCFCVATVIANIQFENMLIHPSTTEFSAFL